MEKFTIRIEARDINGKIFVDSNGSKRPDFTYDVEMIESNMENSLRYIGKTFKAWMPTAQISIEASVFDTISRTYMSVYSLYVDEDRFIKHK
jgi:hypothetical protein